MQSIKIHSRITTSNTDDLALPQPKTLNPTMVKHRDEHQKHFKSRVRPYVMPITLDVLPSGVQVHTSISAVKKEGQKGILSLPSLLSFDLPAPSEGQLTHASRRRYQRECRKHQVEVPDHIKSATGKFAPKNKPVHVKLLNPDKRFDRRPTQLFNSAGKRIWEPVPRHSIPAVVHDSAPFLNRQQHKFANQRSKMMSDILSGDSKAIKMANYYFVVRDRKSVV